MHRAFKTLHEYEQWTWTALEQEHKKGHPQVVTTCAKAARDRLLELQIDDDTLYSVRVSDTARVWGIKRGDLLEVLWWDPNHEVYPTNADKSDRRNLSRTPQTRPIADLAACPFKGRSSLFESKPCRRCDISP